jgi:uncharacterized membrane protein YhaH (DUF805 family)
MNQKNPYRSALLIVALISVVVALFALFLGASINTRGESIEDLQAGTGFIGFGQQAFVFAIVVFVVWLAVSAVGWRASGDETSNDASAE